MIPGSGTFAYEYPKRCLSLLHAFKADVEERELLGSFGLMMAGALLVIPWERTKGDHVLEGDDNDINSAIRKIKGQKFLEADFWQTNNHSSWKKTKIKGEANNPNRWRGPNGLHPFNQRTKNEMPDAKVDRVIRIMRNAIAHGSVVYLDERGKETPGEKVAYLAFVALGANMEYEALRAAQKSSDYTGINFDLVMVSELDFITFLEEWATWLSQIPLSNKVIEIDALVAAA